MASTCRRRGCNESLKPPLQTPRGFELRRAPLPWARASGVRLGDPPTVRSLTAEAWVDGVGDPLAALEHLRAGPGGVLLALAGEPLLAIGGWQRRSKLTGSPVRCASSASSSSSSSRGGRRWAGGSWRWWRSAISLRPSTSAGGFSAASRYVSRTVIRYASLSSRGTPQRASWSSCSIPRSEIGSPCSSVRTHAGQRDLRNDSCRARGGGSRRRHRARLRLAWWRRALSAVASARIRRDS